LQHPLFWPPERRAAFLVHCSNFLAARPAPAAAAGAHAPASTAVAAAAAAASVPLPGATAFATALERGAGAAVHTVVASLAPAAPSARAAAAAAAAAAAGATVPVGWLQLTTPPTVVASLLSSRPFSENSVVDTIRFFRNREGHSKDGDVAAATAGPAGGSSAAGAGAGTGAGAADSAAEMRRWGRASYRALVGSGSGTADRVRFFEARLPQLLLAVYRAAAAALVAPEPARELQLFPPPVAAAAAAAATEGSADDEGSAGEVTVEVRGVDVRVSEPAREIAQFFDGVDLLTLARLADAGAANGDEL
jgi:hypothetical protein